MSSDLTFITNEENQTLKERFEVLIKDTSLFDCLVGYFYSSGFHAIYHSLENTEKIRILIGISTSKQTFALLENANLQNPAADTSQPEREIVRMVYQCLRQNSLWGNIRFTKLSFAIWNFSLSRLAGLKEIKKLNTD